MAMDERIDMDVFKKFVFFEARDLLMDDIQHTVAWRLRHGTEASFDTEVS